MERREPPSEQQGAGELPPVELLGDLQAGLGQLRAPAWLSRPGRDER